MSYTLNHTAEQIDHKLNLISENKNLLPYPYDANSLPKPGLEDVGDGSILTTGEATVQSEIFLNDCILSGGTSGENYLSSVAVTDIIDSPQAVTNPGFSLRIVIDGVEQATSFSVTKNTEKTAQIYLKVPAGCCTKNLLIKPQVEAGDKKTDWVPYMGKIGEYVDERFNGINIKLRKFNNDLNPVLDFMNLVEIVDVQ